MTTDTWPVWRAGFGALAGLLAAAVFLALFDGDRPFGRWAASAALGMGTICGAAFAAPREEREVRGRRAGALASGAIGATTVLIPAGLLALAAGVAPRATVPAFAGAITLGVVSGAVAGRLLNPGRVTLAEMMAWVAVAAGVLGAVAARVR